MLPSLILLVLAWPARAVPPFWHSGAFVQFPIDSLIDESSEIHQKVNPSTPIDDLSSEVVQEEQDSDFESWLTSQMQTSFSLILENIGGISRTFDENEVTSGVVVASPSKSHPNYFFTWVRDSALTIRSLVYEIIDVHDQRLASLKHIIEQYIEVNYHLQRLPNRSGNFDDKGRKGLGEPKFMPDIKPFTESWGRPQSDGPALRVSTIIHYLNSLKDLGEDIDSPFLGNTSRIYHDIIKPDLEYIIANYKTVSFDLWEEIESIHLFNALVQLRGVRDGHLLAKSLNETEDFLATLEETFTQLKEVILDFNTGFRTNKVPYLVETPSLFRMGKRSGLDAASLLATIHAHNYDFQNTEDIPFDVDDSYVLNTITSMVADMKFRYPINRGSFDVPQIRGVGLGRYPEDVYDGYGTSEGNPWFICTASAAEILFKLVYKRITEQSDIIVSTDTKDFYSLFIEDIMEEKITSDSLLIIPFGSERYDRALRNIFTYSDTFLKVLKDHTDGEGRMSEQFNRYTGFMQGAEDLTWSYSSFYNCVRWRLRALEELQHMAVLR